MKTLKKIIRVVKKIIRAIIGIIDKFIVTPITKLALFIGEKSESERKTRKKFGANGKKEKK